MKIGIAVHGRFHAFDLAAALLRQGHDVELLTNLPRWKVAQWFPSERTNSALWHGLVSRAANRLARGEPPAFMEAILKRAFGKWSAHSLAGHKLDVAHSWSGVAEEVMRSRAGRVCSLERSSAHIVTQDRLLGEEAARTGHKLERPSRWIIEREQREYDLADRIIVPSAFARRTFGEQGSTDKVRVVPLAMRTAAFEADASTIEARVRRIAAGDRLRVLYVGMLSYRKGMHDLGELLKRLHDKIDFRLVGPVLPECSDFARAAGTIATVEPAVPQSALPAIYAWGDVFVLPTIEDGFAVVLAQAQAAGLPIMTTSHSGGPDIIAAGGQGWVTAARDAEAMIEQLEWCNEHRTELAQLVEALHRQPPRRDWNDVAGDFVRAVSA